MSRANKLRRVMNWWPPFIGAGIRVETVNDDFRLVRVRLKIRWYNRNYVGTHFGGSLFSMTDPYWMIMIMENLGRDYLVWDKAGEIEFVSAVKEPVWAEFRLDEALLDELRIATASGEKYLRWMPVDVCTANGEVVARVRKQIYVRMKNLNRAQ